VNTIIGQSKPAGETWRAYFLTTWHTSWHTGYGRFNAERELVSIESVSVKEWGG